MCHVSSWRGFSHRGPHRYPAVAVDAVPFPGSINAAYILDPDLVGYVLY
jgi:hypothetical protein